MKKLLLILPLLLLSVNVLAISWYNPPFHIIPIIIIPVTVNPFVPSIPLTQSGGVWNTGGLLPKSDELCAMNTYIPKGILPKKVLTSCWKWVTNKNKIQWMKKYGNYKIKTSITIWRYTWNWWEKI